MNIWGQCKEWQEKGIDCVVATVIKGESGAPGKSGFKMLFGRDGRQSGTVGGGAIELKITEMAKEVFRTRKNNLLQVKLSEIDMSCGGNMEVFLEYLPAARRFFIFGAGHIGRALTPLLESIGFTVTLFDDREANVSFADESKERKVIIGNYKNISALHDEIKHSGFTFVATHGHAYDENVMEQLFSLQIDYQYLGVVGSKKKIAGALHRLKEKGFTPPQRFFAPVGLPIGGDSASEIALSIAAEVLAVIYDKKAMYMRTSEK